MPTAADLRARAEADLASAQSLLAQDADNASYLAGLAAEKALKARYCGLMGWLDFPDDRPEMKRRGGKDCFSHDLDELLRISDALRITQFKNIDWDAVADWSVDDRYDRVGSVSPERARTQVTETRALLDELCTFEVIASLQRAQHAIESALGPLNVFALARLTSPPLWHVLYAWDGTDDSNVNTVQQLVRTTLDRTVPIDVFNKLIAGSVALFPDDRLARTLTSYFQVASSNGMFLLTNCVVEELLVPDMYVLKLQPYTR